MVKQKEQKLKKGEFPKWEDLMCGLIIFQIDGKEIKKCPNCKFKLDEIKEVRFLNFGNKLFIQTNPN